MFYERYSRIHIRSKISTLETQSQADNNETIIE